MHPFRAAAMLVVLLSALPAAAQGSFADKFFEEARKESLRDLEEGDPKEQLSAAKSLGVEGAAKSAPVLAKLLSHPDAAIRLEAASALWTLAGKSAEAFAPARPALTAALDDPDGAVAMNAAGALGAMKVGAETLAPARRRVLAQPGTPYVRFLAARGLIGLDPAAVLAPALTTYLEQVAAAAKRGGSRDNVALARQALERLVDTKDRGAMPHLVDELRRTQHGQVVLMRALHRYSPRPEGWTDLLLAQAASPDREVASTAWDLLGEQHDPASLAKWPPQAARLLASADRRDMALSAFGRAAGKTATGLAEIAAVAKDASAEEDQRLRAIAILGTAADARTAKGSHEVSRAALAQLLAVCEPILGGGPPGKAFEACTSPLGMAIPDQKERAKHYARWLAANKDPAAKIQHLQRLEGLWSDAFDQTEVVKAELANPAPGVKQAAEKALDRIRPAWRESGARQAKQAAPSVAKAAPAPAGKGPGADGAALYSAIRVGDVAAVKKLVTRANVAQPVRFGQVQNPPVPLIVAINYCGIPTVTPAKLAEIVAHMMAMGADPEVKDHTGANLFDRAKQACPPEVIAALGG